MKAKTADLIIDFDTEPTNGIPKSFAALLALNLDDLKQNYVAAAAGAPKRAALAEACDITLRVLRDNPIFFNPEEIKKIAAWIRGTAESLGSNHEGFKKDLLAKVEKIEVKLVENKKSWELKILDKPYYDMSLNPDAGLGRFDRKISDCKKDSGNPEQLSSFDKFVFGPGVGADFDRRLSELTLKSLNLKSLNLQSPPLVDPGIYDLKLFPFKDRFPDTLVSKLKAEAAVDSIRATAKLARQKLAGFLLEHGKELGFGEKIAEGFVSEKGVDAPTPFGRIADALKQMNGTDNKVRILAATMGQYLRAAESGKLGLDDLVDLRLAFRSLEKELVANEAVCRGLRGINESLTALGFAIDLKVILDNPRMNYRGNRYARLVE